MALDSIKGMITGPRPWYWDWPPPEREKEEVEVEIAEGLEYLYDKAKDRKFYGERTKKLKFVCISDTHSKHRKVNVPDGDVLIHSGDFILKGKMEEYEDFAVWLGGLPHTHKILIAGNHDEMFDRFPNEARKLLEPHCTYLQDSSTIIDGIKIFGSPWQPAWGSPAFSLKRNSDELKEKWAGIDLDTDILVTHGPAHGNRGGWIYYRGADSGCELLTKAVKKVKPLVHIFGHIHQGYGINKDEYSTYINASSCTVKYRPTNPPIVFEL
eukprot:TRINITY_DN3743_c0_g1_i1.p1 TRINITY_DN3743_c0_g1~~TRINITY_DN3743_c0_g1_i1.p1  ORF type:complete len:268 (-),score=56.05 TRINITY_DN3743_c0_g1_i1:27-830(-)